MFEDDLVSFNYALFSSSSVFTSVNIGKHFHRISMTAFVRTCICSWNFNLTSIGHRLWQCCTELHRKLTKLANHPVLEIWKIISPLAGVCNHLKCVTYFKNGSWYIIEWCHSNSIPILVGQRSRRRIRLVKLEAAGNTPFDSKPKLLKPVTNKNNKFTQ